MGLRRNIWLTILGFAGACSVGLTAGLLPTRPGRIPPVWWFGHPARTSGQEALAGWGFLLGLAALTIAWVALVRSEPSVRRVSWTALLWAVPLLLETPAASHDVHAYLAQGALLDHGGDPNAMGPNHIGDRSVLNAVDPVWRNSRAPYGPLALGASRLAAIVGEHHQIAGLVILRAFACLGVALAGWCIVHLAGQRAGQALALTVASPLAMVSLISAAHHEGLVVGLCLAALLAHSRGFRTFGYTLAMSAGMVKVPGFVVLGALVVTDLWVLRAWWATAWRAGVAVAAVVALSWAIVPSPFGFVRALSTPGLGSTWWAPTQRVAAVLPGGVHAWRTAGQVVAVLIVLLIFATAQYRPVAATAGWALLSVALLGPVLYPWYLVPPAFVLVLAPGVGGRRVAAIAGGAGQLLGMPRLGNLGAVIGR